MNAVTANFPSDEQLGLPFPAPEPLFGVREAAEVYGLKYWLLLRAVNNGDVPVYRFGNARRRVRLSDIEKLIQASRV